MWDLAKYFDFLLNYILTKVTNYIGPEHAVGDRPLWRKWPVKCGLSGDKGRICNHLECSLSTR